MVTIQDVAKACGVSAATVSHVLNNTRYVRPDIAEKVHTAVAEMGYQPLRKRKSPDGMVTGKREYIGFIIDRGLLTVCGCRSYVKMANSAGWITIAVDKSINQKQIEHFIKQFHLSRVLIHSSVELQCNEALSVPPACIMMINQAQSAHLQGAASLILDYHAALKLALQHLIHCGHSDITILCGRMNSFCRQQIFSAIKWCAEHEKVPITENNILWLDRAGESTEYLKTVGIGTAVVSIGIPGIQAIMHYCALTGLNAGSDFSLVAIDDDAFITDHYPSVTSVQLDPMRFGEVISGRNTGSATITCTPSIIIRDTSNALARDLEGNIAGKANALALSLTEKLLLRKRKITLGISFSDASTLYSDIVIQGIQDTASNLNIALLPIQDAKNDPELQQHQLSWLLEQGTDALISISNDHNRMTKAFTKIAHSFGIPLILGTHLPAGLSDYSYRSCIVTNDEEKGRLVAKFMADRMQQDQNVFLFFDKTTNIGGERCAASVISTLSIDYPQIHIRGQMNLTGDQAIKEFQKVLLRYPDIHAVYVQNAKAAGETSEYLVQIGREDIILVTSQISSRVAKQILQSDTDRFGIVSSQPVDMGKMMVYAAGSVLLGKSIPKYIALKPLVAEKKNVQDIWPLLTQSRLQ